MRFPLAVDLDDALPIYAQIARQIRALLGRGYWREGDRLPSVRETAVRLRVNPLTVVRAYRELQEERLLEARAGAGVFVSKVPKGPRAAAREELRRRLREIASDAAALGVGREELEEMLVEACRRTPSERPR